LFGGSNRKGEKVTGQFQGAFSKVRLSAKKDLQMEKKKKKNKGESVKLQNLAKLSRRGKGRRGSK